MIENTLLAHIWNHPFEASAGANTTAGMGGVAVVAMMVALAFILVTATRMVGQLVAQMTEIIRIASSALASSLFAAIVAVIFLVMAVHSMR